MPALLMPAGSAAAASAASAAAPQQQRIRLTVRCEAEGKVEELRLPIAIEDEFRID
jgi:hypothetical protein